MDKKESTVKWNQFILIIIYLFRSNDNLMTFIEFSFLTAFKSTLNLPSTLYQLRNNNNTENKQ